MKSKDINACSFDVLQEYSRDVFGTISYVYLPLVFIAIIPRMNPWNIHVLLYLDIYLEHARNVFIRSRYD